MSASGRELSEYHLEAAIAAQHVMSPSIEQTDWSAIIALYDTLMTVSPSPIVALNRAIAIGQRDGPARGIEEIGRIANQDRLTNYPFLATALGEFELRGARTACSRGRESALCGGNLAGRGTRKASALSD